MAHPGNEIGEYDGDDNLMLVVAETSSIDGTSTIVHSTHC
jgi:hypothetical protein